MKIEAYTAVRQDDACYEDPPVGTMYVAYDETAPWAVAYHCPCGGGHVVHLPLTGIKRQYGAQWELSLDGSLPTLSPSIQDLGTCRSHYFIRGGKVVWA